MTPGARRGWTSHGDLILLPDQDRGRWDHEEIREGVALLEQALRRSAVMGGPGQLPVAGRHRGAARRGASRRRPRIGRQIEALYGQLARVAPSPVVELNRAVAVAMARGPEQGLARLDALAATGVLDANHLLHAARADLLSRLGRRGEARASYQRAAAMATTAAEQRFLQRRLDELDRWGRARTALGLGERAGRGTARR